MPKNKITGQKGQVELAPIVILVLLIIAVIFVLRGGGSTSRDGIRFGSSGSSGTVEEREERITRAPRSSSPTTPPSGTDNQTPTNESPFKGKIRISRGSATRTTPAEENLTLFYSSSGKENIPLTGWSLENSKGERFTIGTTAFIPLSGQINPQQGIFLEPGGRVYVVTGASPIGTNFRTNICVGYLNQFNTFIPRISERCPEPEDEPQAANFEDSCLDFIERIPRCRQTFNIPLSVSLSCRNYVNSNVNYSSCISNHRNDADFFGNEWYVYLGRPSEIWKQKRETITLRDFEGKVVESISY